MEGSARKTGGFLGSIAAFERMSGNPLLRFMRDGDKSLKIIETERGAVAPFPD